MKVLLVEDEPLAAERVRQLLEALRPGWTLIGPATSLREASLLLQSASFDLAFFDIHLSDGLSLQLFESNRVTCPVIFTTAYDQYAVRAFRLHSVDYLLKPLDKEDFEQALAHFEQQKGRQLPEVTDLKALVKSLLSEEKLVYKERFIVKVGDKLKSVSTEDIRLILSADKACFLQLSDRRYPVDFTLDQLEKQLDPRKFYRINRKYLVHIDAIREIHAWFNSRWKLEITGIEGEELIVSREKSADFKRWLDQ